MNKSEISIILVSFISTVFLIYLSTKPSKEDNGGVEVSDFLYLSALISCFFATIF
jgi:hypothetical protein